jgi:hypothetical protein
MPAVKAMGLEMYPTGIPGSSPRFIIRGNPISGFYAARIVFGLDSCESEYLFRPTAPMENRPKAPGYSATAKEVSDHIRQFLTWKRWPGEAVKYNAQAV